MPASFAKRLSFAPFVLLLLLCAQEALNPQPRPKRGQGSQCKPIGDSLPIEAQDPGNLNLPAVLLLAPSFEFV